MTQFFTVVFYLMGIVPLMIEITALSTPRRYLSIKRRTSSDSKEKKKLTPGSAMFMFSGFYYGIWTFLGLFSSQGLLFLGLFLLGIISYFICKVKSIELVWTVIDAIISFGLILFIILNRYQFHIDVDQWVINQFG